MALVLRKDDDLRVPALAAEEKAWAKKLDALLAKMPERLKLIEVDDTLVLVDREAAADRESGTGFAAVREAGAVLAELTGGILKISGMTW
jgi:hypothetical protein